MNESIYFVRDGKAEGPYSRVGSIALSPRGDRVAYTAALDGESNWVLVRDEKKGEAFDQAGQVSLSPDGLSAACPAKKSGMWFMVRNDGNESKDGPYPAVGTPAFSPEGKRLAFPAMIGKEWYVVSGIMRYGPFAKVWSVLFLPDGRLSIIADSGSNTYHYTLAGD